ncbi:MAG: hypothetical protein U1D30_18605 [Planctomycetota bacterium]
MLPNPKKRVEREKGFRKKLSPRRRSSKKTVRRKSTKKKVDPHRLRLVWGVFDNSNQQVATFHYSDRAGADKKAEEMTEKGRGPYFVQPVKEPLPLEPEPAKVHLGARGIIPSRANAGK